MVGIMVIQKEECCMIGRFDGQSCILKSIIHYPQLVGTVIAKQVRQKNSR